MTSEGTVKAEILAALGRRQDLMIWNNPTGTGRSLTGNRVISFGCPGSGDILGVYAMTITPDMVGETFGLALSIETKRRRGGRQERQQKNFERAWIKRGGLYILARSVEGVNGALGDAATPIPT